MSEEELKVNTTETVEEDKKQKKPKSKVRKILEWVFTIVFGALFVFFAIGQVDGMIHKQENYGQTLTYGHGTFIITTNSMEPDYKVGTAIITYKEKPENIVKMFDEGKVVDITMFSYFTTNDSKYNYSNYRPGDISYGGIDYKLEGNNPVYPNSPQAITHRLIGYHIEEDRELGQGRYMFVIAGINTNGELSKEGQYQLLTENELLGIVKVNSSVLGGLFRFITSPWGLLVFLLIPAFYLVITSVLDIFKAMKEPDEEAASTSEQTSSPSGGTLDSLSPEDRERLKKEMLEEMLKKKGGK